MLMGSVIKLITASAVGLIVGTERALQNKNVGVGTCSLITMASTLLTVLANEMTSGDPSRLVANIITSVGFLCGGVIFVRGGQDSDTEEVVGLTTGAILFCLSAVGIAIGLGYYEIVGVSTVLILVNVTVARLFKKYVYDCKGHIGEIKE